ncbi:ABC transporter permease [Echinicola sediminis]
MALRDFRKNKAKLLLFVSSIVIGIAALVAISSFGDNLSRDIDSQAKELLGADLVLENNKPLGAQELDTVAREMAQEISFASMASFPKVGDSRLVHVRALEGRFPFYGKIETVPVAAADNFRAGGKKALVEKILLDQYDIAVGDSVRVGEVTFEIVGELHAAPGQTGITATVAPVVYIPMQYAEETGLIQYGSRVNYQRYYSFALDTDVDELIKPYDELWEEEHIDADTVEDRKRSTGRSFENLSDFLSLVAFIALLLGCVGVASAVNVFVKEKLPSVAVLRCLGVSSRDTFLIYMTQIKIMGVIGSILGAFLGSVIQYILPQVFSDFLPVDVTVQLSWASIGFGVITGIFISVLFALLPLLKIRKVPPIMTLRTDAEVVRFVQDPLRWLVMLGIALFIFGFSMFLLRGWEEALGFTGFVLLAFGVLWFVGTGIMWLIKRFLPLSLAYPVRQSLANLYRPNNQTISLVATIGLGTAMISTLFFVQNQLLDQVRFADKEEQPNMLFFDIQTPQVDNVIAAVKKEGLPVMQEVPIVTMRLDEINGVDKSENGELPEESQKSRGLYNREFRVTYRDTLVASEKLVEGSLHKVKEAGDSIYVSFDKGYADRTGINLGDELLFNVQGRPIKAYVGSFREVNFRQVSTNFLVLFPANVLEKAPKFHVVITKSQTDEQAAKVQNEIVKAFPNISVINLEMIVDTLEDILSKISFVIQFMALFSIVTGILVLISSLIISKYQRMKESILLRTLGASTPVVRTINTLEYFFLGSLASLSGILLSFLATALLNIFVFDFPVTWAWMEAAVIYLVITAITVLLGWLNGKNVINKPPMEILRG